MSLAPIAVKAVIIQDICLGLLKEYYFNISFCSTVKKNDIPHLLMVLLELVEQAQHTMYFKNCN